MLLELLNNRHSIQQTQHFRTWLAPASQEMQGYRIVTKYAAAGFFHTSAKYLMIGQTPGWLASGNKDTAAALLLT